MYIFIYILLVLFMSLFMCARGVCVNRIHIENLYVAWMVDGCEISSNLKLTGPAQRHLVDRT